MLNTVRVYLLPCSPCKTRKLSRLTCDINLNKPYSYLKINYHGSVNKRFETRLRVYLVPLTSQSYISNASEERTRMSSPILLIGFGNEYRSDDSIGLYVIRTLKEQKLPETIMVESSGDGTELIEMFSMAGWQF